MTKREPQFECPLPTKCIYDDYLRTGVHYCSKGHCIHKRLLRTQIARQIHQLVSIKNISPRQSLQLRELKEKYAKTLSCDDHQTSNLPRFEQFREGKF